MDLPSKLANIKPLSSAVALSLFVVACGGGSHVWKLVYPGSSSVGSTAMSLTLTDNNALVMTNQHLSNASGYYSSVAKISTDGELLWDYQIDSSAHGGSRTLANNRDYITSIDNQGNILVTASAFDLESLSIESTSIYKLSADGELLWEQTYAANGLGVLASNDTNDYYLALIGNTYTLIQYDELGEENWQTPLFNNEINQVSAIRFDRSGHLYVASDSELIQLNTTGEIVDTMLASDLGFDKIEAINTGNSQIAVSGSTENTWGLAILSETLSSIQSELFSDEANAVYLSEVSDSGACFVLENRTNSSLQLGLFSDTGVVWQHEYVHADQRIDIDAPNFSHDQCFFAHTVRGRQPSDRTYSVERFDLTGTSLGRVELKTTDGFVAQPEFTEEGVFIYSATTPKDKPLAFSNVELFKHKI